MSTQKSALDDKPLSRADIVHLLRTVVNESGGEAVGLRRFCEATGLPKHGAWRLQCPVWSDIVAEAGVATTAFSGRITDDQILAVIAECVRAVHRFPATLELSSFLSAHPNGCSPKTIRNRWPLTADVAAALADWADRNDAGDVAAIAREYKPGRSTRPLVMEGVTATTPSNRPFLPAYFDDLERIGRGHADRVAVPFSGTAHREYELRVHQAFRTLGAQVQLLGQGAGRVPDGHAFWPGECFLAWDAKSRRDRYRLGTEDRKFKEYCDETATKVLSRHGTIPLYFVVVSSAFQPGDVDEASRLVRSARVKALTLLTSGGLQALIEMRVEHPESVDPRSCHALFSRTRILDRADVARALRE